MDQRDIERLALEIRERAGVPEGEVWLATQIVRGAFGRAAFGTIPRMHTAACLIWRDGLPKIIVRDGATDLNFKIAHEAGHIALRLAAWTGARAEEEELASAIGAAIVAPSEAVRRAYAFYGDRLRPLAKTFAITQTSMSLRLGEVMGDERAVITKTPYVLKRGWISSSDAQLLLWRDHPAPRGIAKVRLTGCLDEGRVAFRNKLSK